VAGLGQLDVLPEPVEEVGADGAFELLHLIADAGLAQAQVVRRHRKAQSVGHGAEDPQLVQRDTALKRQRPAAARGSRHPTTLFGMAAQRKPKPSLSAVRRTRRPVPNLEAPELEQVTVSEQKINQYRKRRYDAIHAGGEPKGRLSARARLDLLLDKGSFAELDLWAKSRAVGFGMEERRIAGDAMVAGFGTVDSRPVAVYAYDATVMGGSLGEVTAEKIVKVQELAYRDRVPIIGINDSGGARIQEGVAALAGYADIFMRNVRSSGVVPQVSVIAGPTTGGAVYSPAITDFIFMVRGVGHMFITGPEVVKVTTGEHVTFDDLGGAEVHAAKSGVAHFISSNERECAKDIRRLLAYLPSSSAERPPYRPSGDDPERANTELQSIVPDSPNLPYDMRTVVLHVVDGAEWLEVQPFFAQNIVVGFARLNGHVIGVVGNQPKVLAGAIDINASVKAARFFRFCDAFNIPLVSFVDVPGYLPGTAQEHGGIIRNGAKLLYAYAEATVPKLTVITRKAYGGAYDVMSSKHIRG